MKIISAANLEALRKSIIDKRDPNKTVIAVCNGTGCHAYGCENITSAMIDEIERQNVDAEVRKTGCHGFCERGTLVVIHPQEIFYQQVKVEDIPEIVSETLVKGKLVERLLYKEPGTENSIIKESDVPFYNKQRRLIFGNNGQIDPTSIEDYIAIGGYNALNKALTMEPEKIIEEIKKSGLRGRGGGGFPTARKWESCRNAPSSDGIRYVICNADEGDPGAYMDRSLVEGNPHSVLEGMIIGAYAVGSSEGFIYIRHEYPLAVENIRTAIAQAEKYGLLGDNILGSGFNFKVTIVRGGGAFVCGESSALIASLEGEVGEPRAKYVHMAEKGLWNKPSLLNNVKTWANVTLIINRGADWYSKIGTEGSKGTMIFSLVGNITNTGLVEVPMGITLREMIYDIGGGIPNGKKFKGVQIGGPSGGVVPEEYLDTPIDFDELTKLGSMMGSGGMIVMDEDTCMVDIAKYFINFLLEESCGKCIPCREGLYRMNKILTKITDGDGETEDLALLGELADIVRDGSLCGLGQTAANSVITTLRYFKEEYMEHIEKKMCGAGVCKALTKYVIDTEICTACMRCLRECPTSAIKGEKKNAESFLINQGLCIQCGICREVCKFNAIKNANR